MQFSNYDYIESKFFSGKIILTSFPGLNKEGTFEVSIFNEELNLFKNNKYLEYGKEAKINAENFLWDRIIENYKRIL